MFARKYFISLFAGTALLAAACASVAADGGADKAASAASATNAASTTSTTSTTNANYPAVIQSLQKQGLDDVQEFKAGQGLRGFAGMAGEDPTTVYVTPDGNAIVGTRVSPDGRVVDEALVQKLMAKPMSDALWAKLESYTWVLDGKASAPRVVYMITDANCPYCHRFWEAARPWVDAGKVQVRDLLVGVIKADSSTKAAAILGAKDQSAALEQNERDFDKGGIAPAASVPPDVRKVLGTNQALMAEMGFRGTPGIIYQDDQGLVQRLTGMPQPDDLGKILGPR
ncbi:thiol:disulfide interchange protein DsbG [Candidimonas nitroreducens]|uniref:Thiol:disulfide interchange protein n=1 Tax=Candidimonas nitroreducens TaxID=683354 RepID=A0A225LZF4_9BURK|nr:thiol:disulfide interchange protein DsbG [Candidimonas nitroreducens]OWT54478.1 thiol:disulfide interchange protein DsbG [Candidimonas nitroreducens]